MARFVLYSEYNFESWDWTNSVEKGIGGSETSHVEMAWRLARRGHEVICYAPVPWKGTREWRGTTWTHCKNADFSLDGTWVIYRVPHVMDKFGERRPEQPRWFMCQDAHYGDALTGERSAKFDRILPLCGPHAEHLMSAYPKIGNKVWVTTNGVKVDLVREVEQESIVRNPKKLIYASSPDRGLVTLLSIFKRAREIVPDLELHVFYGFHNINMLTKGSAPWKDALIKIKRDVTKAAKQDGVFLRDRVDQKTLYREWLSAGIWCYPTEFGETSAITCMEAQAMGGVPIFNPFWALRENVAWGVALEGNVYSDPLVQARYAGEIVRLTRDDAGIALQEEIRVPMMSWARNRFNWERAVDQWECSVLGIPGQAGQFCFQFKHARGKVLNVGCDSDHVGWREYGATNIDVRPVSPVTKNQNRYHLLHDVRTPFPASLGTFDTVVLGDILEHVQAEDWYRALTNCRAVLNPGGRLIITCPDDGNRERLAQHLTAYGNEVYAEGCSAFHTRDISHDAILAELARAGLREVTYQVIDYTLFVGHGIVCEPIPVPQLVSPNGRIPHVLMEALP